MVQDGPVRKAVGVAQIAQVVAVAPHLILQLGVGQGRASHMLVHQRVVLRQPLRQVAYVLVHLQHKQKAFLALHTPEQLLGDVLTMLHTCCMPCLLA